MTQIFEYKAQVQIQKKEVSFCRLKKVDLTSKNNCSSQWCRFDGLKIIVETNLSHQSIDLSN